MELQKLYADNQVNPLAGCLPSLAQIPIFIGLYRSVLALAKEDKLEESFLWLPSLEGPVADYTKGTGRLFGSAEQITETVYQNIRDAGGKGKHLLNLGHGVLQQTPEESIRYFVEAAKELKLPLQ